MKNHSRKYAPGSSGLFLFACAVISCVFVNCGREGKAAPRVTPGEGVVFPALAALGWIDTEGEPGGERFASASGDGVVRIWEVYSGRMTRAPGGGETEACFLSAIEEGDALYLSSPDGTKNLYPADDGSIILTDAASGKELARYYALGDEWISVSAEGFYNASFAGAALLAAERGGGRLGLKRLSGALFRPDLYRALLAGENPALPFTLEDLFEEDKSPPLVSLSAPEGESAPGTLKVSVRGQKGGTGLLALYRRSGGKDIPAGLIDTETAAERIYSEKGETCYEIMLDIGEGETGISAFNRDNTVESEPVRHYGADSAGNGAVPGGKPAALKALLASGDDGRESAEALAEFLFRQKEGELYSGVEIIRLFGESFGRAAFVKGLAGFRAEAANNRRSREFPEPGQTPESAATLLVYLRGAFLPGERGDLRIAAPGQGDAAESVISAEDILKEVLAPGLNPVLLLDLESGAPREQLETALLRFRERLGPGALLAVCKDPGAEDILADTLVRALAHDFSVPGTGAENRYIGTAEFFGRGSELLAGKGAAVFSFLPLEDFPVAGRFINTGELTFQTMASGLLKIDKVDKNPVPLAFGKNTTRVLPAGTYIIDMVYRNGYKETRTVELREKDSAWVIFTYTPPLLVGDFSRQLPSSAINVSELNPANYEKINREAMEGMGMQPYYVAFLAGEKFYREGNYDRAIAEYSRAVSLRPSYADAWASRGNARRRKGDLAGALEDYNRALSLESGFVEVYNYRGYIYAQRGDQNRAIADYTQAIRRRADYADAFFNRAYSYSAQGSWDQAVADYTQVIKLEPSNAVAYRERARAYRGKGETSKAAADYATAEKL